MKMKCNNLTPFDMGKLYKHFIVQFSNTDLRKPDEPIVMCGFTMQSDTCDFEVGKLYDIEIRKLES